MTNAPTHPQTLAGHSFVFTGETHDITRAQVRQFIELAGGTLTGDFAPSTTYLVAGGPNGISAQKLKRAALLGIPVITEAQFLALLAGK